LADELRQTAPGLSSRLARTSADLADAFPEGRAETLPEGLGAWAGEVAKEPRQCRSAVCADRFALSRFAWRPGHTGSGVLGLRQDFMVTVCEAEQTYARLAKSRTAVM
jgi:hypothetical protein